MDQCEACGRKLKDDDTCRACEPTDDDPETLPVDTKFKHNNRRVNRGD